MENEGERGDEGTGSFYMSQPEHNVFNLLQVSDIKKEYK